MFDSELLAADLKREVSADEAVYDITYYMSSHMMPLGWHQENKMEIHKMSFDNNNYRSNMINCK